MRENTQALISDPRFSVQDFGPKGKWGMLRFASPREMLECVIAHAWTDNERVQDRDPHWLGLGSQSLADLAKTGIPAHALAQIKQASAALPHKFSRPGIIQPAIAGGSWSIPAVLVGLPLAARSRARTKLAPLTINLVCAWSASVTETTLAPTFARLARAIHDYTLAGGAVTLTCHYLSHLTSYPIPGLSGAGVSIRIPANDLAQIALGCSVMANRVCAMRLRKALSTTPDDSMLPIEAPSNPIPASIYLGGRTETGDIGPSLASTLEALAIR